ncbi:MAG: signal peptidase II [Bdellovibrio sp.]|nr:signal peptidase II [Bdellovibrio sp.]
MSGAARKLWQIKFKYWVLISLSGVLVGLDQITKSMILDKFRLGESISVLQGYFNITYVQNKGAAFGMLAQANPAFRVPFFLIVPLVALGSIAYIFRKIPDQDKKLAIALSLVIGGAVGNLIDRVTLGYVVDFLDFHWQWGYHFPAFNVADSAICVGVGLVILDLFAPEEGKSHRKGSRANVPSSH